MYKYRDGENAFSPPGGSFSEFDMIQLKYNKGLSQGTPAVLPCAEENR